MADASKFSVAKLNDTNYQAWKFKMKMLMIREETWTYVVDSAPEPRTAPWIAGDRKAQSTICLSLDDSQIVHVCNCSTAKAMWEELQKVHERANLSNKLYLLRKLYQSKLGPEEDMQGYIRRTLELVERLRGIGQETTDFQVAALLLSGLPESYEALVTALDARPDDALTLEYVRGKLVDEFNRKHQTTGVTSDAESALRAQGRDHPKTSSDRKECYFCKATGHYRKDCPAWRAQGRPSHRRRPRQRARAVKSCASSSSETAFLLGQGTSSKSWYIDSGATSHMCNDRAFFTEGYRSKTETVTVANGQKISSQGIGDGILHCQVSETASKPVSVKNVLYVPSLESNLLSVKKMTQQGHVVTFSNGQCVVTKNQEVVATGKIENDLYSLSTVSSQAASLSRSSDHRDCIHVWHHRLGHRDPHAIQRLQRDGLAHGIHIQECSCPHQLKCGSCIKGKMSRKPFPTKSASRAEDLLDLIHTDVCGPMRVSTASRNRYFLTFTDDFSRYTVLYLLKSKHEVPAKLEEYLAFVYNKFGKHPKILRADNGTEYTSEKSRSILRRYGIQLQTTVPYNPEQNGVAERKNRTLCESARSMLFGSGLPKILWGEAIVTACYIQNRLPTRVLDKTPYEVWNGRKPSLEHLRMFGSRAYVHIPKEKRGKWDARAVEGTLVGFSETQKGYRVLIQGSYTVKVTRSVVIDESPVMESFCSTSKAVLPSTLEQGESSSPTGEDIEVGLLPDTRSQIQQPLDQENDAVRCEPRRSARTNKGIPPDRLTYIAQAAPSPDPGNWKEMEKLPHCEKQKWIDAANDEMESLRQLNTWILAELPPGKRAFGCRWIFKTKRDKDGNIERYKARLVAQGFSQKFGEDYDATFAPVAKLTTLRVVLSVAVAEKLQVRHFDVKTAFLNGDVEEDIYMRQPEGFVAKGEEHLVCKLKKSLYGLKQAARAWNIKANEVLLEEGFTRSQADPCLYTQVRDGKRMYILLYVDDMLMCHQDDLAITDMWRRMNNYFELKDLGPVNHYLGIEIERPTEDCFLLHQKHKIDSLVTKYGLETAKGCSTPMDAEYLKFTGDDNLLTNDESYREAVGELLYLSTTTRPDIACAIGILCRRVSKPRQLDWDALKRVLRYLKHTRDMKLKLSADCPMELVCYVDADWAGDVADRKSTSGYLVQLGSCPVSWSTRKQLSVALSSTEAEYVAAAYASQEVLWLQQLLSDLGRAVHTPTRVLEDNQGCIKLAVAEGINARTKHIDVRHHHLRDLVNRGVIDLQYCESGAMTADAFTKPLPRPRLEALRQRIGLVKV